MVRRCLVVLMLYLFLVVSAAYSDVVIDWNNITLDTIRQDSLKPTVACRALAMVHIAIYDAVSAIDGQYEAFHIRLTPPDACSEEAAAASAAHGILINLFPGRAATYNAALAASLAEIVDGTAKVNGVVYGVSVADAILSWRADDGSGVVMDYPVGTLPGQWRPTPPTYSPAFGMNWMFVDPFAMITPSQFRPGPPPDIRSWEYASAVCEVMYYGAKQMRNRPVDWEQIAYFWADDVSSISPPGRWNVIAQAVSERMYCQVPENARLFALLNVAMADAAIACWDCKYTYALWRPVTAIRLAGTDGNRFTVPIANWEPLLPTPNFPEYVSGHSTFAGAGAEILASFHHSDRMSFALQSTTPLAHARSFTSFTQACWEDGQSRIYGGIHFRFANSRGQLLGRTIAGYVLQNFMHPIK